MRVLLLLLGLAAAGGLVWWLGAAGEGPVGTGGREAEGPVAGTEGAPRALEETPEARIRVVGPGERPVTVGEEPPTWRGTILKVESDRPEGEPHRGRDLLEAASKVALIRVGSQDLLDELEAATFDDLRVGEDVRLHQLENVLREQGYAVVLRYPALLIRRPPER